MRVPRAYKFIIKYITPAFLLRILGMWFWQEWIPILTMKGVAPENRPLIRASRAGLCAVFLVLVFLVRSAWRRKKRKYVELKGARYEIFR